MTIEELEDKHFTIWYSTNEDSSEEIYNHTKLSIQFAIEVLESLDRRYVGDTIKIDEEEVNDKIQELKQYLDGN